MSINNTEKGPGPKSAHARQRDAEAGVTSGSETEKEKTEPETATPLQQPAQVHHEPGADRTVDAAPVAAETR